MVLRLLPEAQGLESQVIFVPGKLVTLVVHRARSTRTISQEVNTKRQEGRSKQ